MPSPGTFLTPLTFTCVPPGSGRRIGVDRDDDGFFDLDETLNRRTDPACGGDCDNSGPVTVDEILKLVNIALGDADMTACEAGDMNADHGITVDEILTALNHALNGCEAG